MSNICQLCSAPAKLRCPICRVPYCSTDHQKVLYKFHKLICVPTFPKFVQPELQRWEIDLWAKTQEYPYQGDVKNIEDSVDQLLGAAFLPYKNQPSRTVEAICKTMFPNQDSSEMFWKHTQEQFRTFNPPALREFIILFTRETCAITDTAEEREKDELGPIYYMDTYIRAIKLNLISTEVQDRLLQDFYLYFSLVVLSQQGKLRDGFISNEGSAIGKRIVKWQEDVSNSDLPLDGNNVLGMLTVFLSPFRSDDLSIPELQKIARDQHEIRNKRVALVPPSKRKFI